MDFSFFFKSTQECHLRAPLIFGKGRPSVPNVLPYEAPGFVFLLSVFVPLGIFPFLPAQSCIENDTHTQSHFIFYLAFLVLFQKGFFRHISALLLQIKVSISPLLEILFNIQKNSMKPISMFAD